MWTDPTTIPADAGSIQRVLLRAHRLLLLDRLRQLKQQLEARHLDTSKIFTPELLARLQKEIHG
jgi:hypothetical protein